MFILSETFESEKSSHPSENVPVESVCYFCLFLSWLRKRVFLIFLWLLQLVLSLFFRCCTVMWSNNARLWKNALECSAWRERWVVKLFVGCGNLCGKTKNPSLYQRRWVTQGDERGIKPATSPPAFLSLSMPHNNLCTTCVWVGLDWTSILCCIARQLGSCYIINVTIEILTRRCPLG